MMTRVPFLLALISFFFLPSLSFAQKKYALLIGVNQYDHTNLPPLQYAVNDAVKTGELLDKHGYQVTYLTDIKGQKPTKANIEAAIDELVLKFEKGDTLIIGLAGHGLQYPDIKDVFFCPQNARPFKDETKTMISLGSVWSRLEKTYSGTKLVLVDACRNAGIRNSAESIPLPPKGVGVLMSCSDGQFAREHESLKHGVFFHHVIEGLKGAAKDGDENVTWDDLRKYVKLGVPKKINEIYGAESEVKQNPNEMGNLTEVPILIKFGKSPVEIELPKAGEERTFEIAKGVKMKFCWIPPGEVQLGSPQEEQDYLEKIVFGDKRPKYLDFETEAERGKFKTPGFWMGKYEVTQVQWEAVMEKNPSGFKGDKFPVENVSWNDCQDFIKKCSVNGLKIQLPHEDQWEYACRGGKGNKQPFYWGYTLNGDNANCDGTKPYGTTQKGEYKNKTMEVGSYEKVAPHPWGLCDMSGNVSEICQNSITKESLERVNRGGGWYNYSQDCRTAYRRSRNSTSRGSDLGLRLVLVP